MQPNSAEVIGTGAPSSGTPSRVAWSVVALIAVLTALTVAVATNWHPVATVDQTVARWGYRLTYGSNVRSTWWIDVATYGQPMVLRALLLVGATFLAWRRRWLLAGWLAGVTIAETVLGPLAKYLLNRPRPSWLHPIAIEHTTSYPSGHATAAGMFTTALVLLAVVTMQSTAARLATIGVAVVVGAVVSLDRIFLGVHYLTDVLAGLLLGAAVTLAGWLLLLHFASRRTQQSAE